MRSTKHIESSSDHRIIRLTLFWIISMGSQRPTIVTSVKVVRDYESSISPPYPRIECLTICKSQNGTGKDDILKNTLLFVVINRRENSISL